MADAIRAGRRTQDVPLILTLLCLDGCTPAGKYIIDTRPSHIDRQQALRGKVDEITRS